MARKKKVVTAEGKDYGLPKSVSELLKKQADRLRNLFETPDDYPEVQEARASYQEAMKRQGLKNPPENAAEARELCVQLAVE